MKITVMPNDMDAPGCYRCLFPARQLAMRGHTVKMPPYERIEKEDGTFRFVFDVTSSIKNHDSEIWLLQQRKERMWVEMGGGIDMLRERGICTVFDVDDNYLETPPWNPAWFGLHPYKQSGRPSNIEGLEQPEIIRNRASRRSKGLVIEQADGSRITNKRMQLSKVTNAFNREHLHESMKRVDALTVSTPYLAELYQSYNPNVHVVRNYLDWDIWEDIQPQCEVQRDRLRIGYLGTFGYRRGDLEVIKQVIPKLLRRHPEIDFVTNSEETHDFLGVPLEQRITIGEYTFYPGDEGRYPVGDMTAQIDIGLVPLIPGGMAEGKSHLKGMEYNAAGIPYVSSSTESYRYWTRDGVNGYIAESESEWEDELEHLIADDTHRRWMGHQARLQAKDHSIQNNWWRWEQAFADILGPATRQAARGAIKRGAVQKVSELEAFLKKVSDMSPRTVVEVGSARGGTFWALAEMAAEDALLVSIDMPAGSPLDVREGKDVYPGRDRAGMRDYVKEAQRCILLDGDSQSEEMLNRLIDTIGSTKIDVLFIDADHRYAGVKRDYELYAPLVREGGLIAFHDVLPQNDLRSGVHILWNQIKKRNPHRTETFVGADNWGLGKWGGIGVLST